MKLSLDMLMAYAAGAMDPYDAARVVEEVERTPGARARLELAQRVLATARGDDTLDPPTEAVQRAYAIFQPSRRPAASWLDALRRIVAELQFDSRTQAAGAGFRGADDGFQLAYDCNGASIELDFSPDSADRKGAWRLVGQVDAAEGARVSVAVCAAVDGALLGEVEADEHGVFAVGLSAGTFDILVRISEELVVLSGIDIP